tara:strand:+ start:408 stop:1178 length:771 start_codon:yes stop_codon:yes gene_type:complete
MIAVLSATEHDYYAMPLPFVVYSWNKIGIDCIVFVPSGDNPKIKLAQKYCNNTPFHEFVCEEKRIPTYSQVSRLFGACTSIDDNEIYITGDSDLAVFSNYYERLNDGDVHVVGADLTPKDQYPMCFISMPSKKWKKVLGIDKGYQEHIAELIDPIQGLNIRGEQWCYDQWYIKKKLDESGHKIVLHNRSNGQNQFATKRADRDGWHFDVFDIIDAHLPRPLTNEENFNKVYDLFKTKYPTDNLDWMIEYRNEYLKL